jgi:hypothetical protein
MLASLLSFVKFKHSLYPTIHPITDKGFKNVLIFKPSGKAFAVLNVKVVEPFGSAERKPFAEDTPFGIVLAIHLTGYPATQLAYQITAKSLDAANKRDTQGPPQAPHPSNAARPLAWLC